MTTPQTRHNATLAVTCFMLPFPLFAMGGAIWWGAKLDEYYQAMHIFGAYALFLVGAFGLIGCGGLYRIIRESE